MTFWGIGFHVYSNSSSSILQISIIFIIFCHFWYSCWWWYLTIVFWVIKNSTYGKMSFHASNIDKEEMKYSWLIADLWSQTILLLNQPAHLGTAPHLIIAFVASRPWQPKKLLRSYVSEIVCNWLMLECASLRVLSF